MVREIFLPFFLLTVGNLAHCQEWESLLLIKMEVLLAKQETALVKQEAALSQLKGMQEKHEQVEGKLQEIQEKQEHIEGKLQEMQEKLQHVEINLQVPCPAPYIDVGGKCLYFHTATNDTWLNKETLCIGLDGHLLKIDDANLFYDIVNHIKAEEPDTTYFWIGGSDAATEGDWRWTDYTKVKMGTPFWGTYSKTTPQIQEPQGGTRENCIGMTKYLMFYFHDYTCDHAFAGICEHNES
ncbi:lactose-binding lectin l-2-like [Macrobrachium nipponense]|uniref:lactose-binding lectin l-2-like n=1 Tax=Macrobrachium nipponense TaxID=159736 RepID=UPI0030C89625